MQRITAPFLALFAFLFFLSSANAQIVTKDIDYTHNGVKLRGYLAYDSKPLGKRPGVLLAPEWWGLGDYVKRRAREYAEQGYVTFAVDMYGAGVFVDDAAKAGELAKPFYADRNLMRGRAQAALDQLLKNEFVDKARVAALGYCFGGTTVLELARSGAPLVGVISFHGGLSANNATDAKNIRGRVLVLNGAEDPMVKPEERQAFMSEMRGANLDWEFIEYGGAVHAFSNPDVDARNLPGAKYHAKADKRSFERSKNFLTSVFNES